MFTATLAPRARARAVHAVCALLIAIGFGACLAVIAVVRGTLSAPLPYAHAERILALHVQSASLNSSEIPFAWPDWLDVKAESRTFDDVALARNQTFTLADDALPLRVEGARVTPNLAQFLGIPLLLGGGFTGQPGEAVPEAVLSERLWRVHFGGRDDVLGRSVTLSGTTYVVVGVLPAGVRFPTNDVDVWIPLVPAQNELNRNFRFARAYGRVRPDATPAEAREELRSIMDGLQSRYPDSNRDIQAAPVPLRDVYVAAQRPLLVTLAVVVGLVLLVVCGNVAGLLMSQVVSNSGQYALRLALGASRRGIFRTLLRTTVPPALTGVVLGAAAAAAALSLLGIGASEDLRATRMTIDGALVAWAALMAIGVAAVVTILPAVLLAKIRPNEALHSGSKGATMGSAGHRLIGTFVAGQLTLTFVVLAAALVAHAGALRLARTDVGFARDGTLLFALAIPERDLPTSAVLWRRVAERLGELPGVDAAGLLSRPPLFAGASSLGLIIDGSPLATREGTAATDARLVDGDAMAALDLQLISGRFLDARVAGEGDVIVVDQTFAELYFPGQDPIDRIVTFKSDDKRPFRIVGVVREAQWRTLDAAKEPTVLMPASQFAFVGALRAPWGVVRSTSGAAPSEMRIREALASVDPSLSAAQFTTLGRLADDALHVPQAGAQALALLSVVAILIGGAGVFAMLWYSVQLRQREFGIRLSFGAAGSDLFLGTARRGFVLSATGAALGLLVAVIGARVAQQYVVGLEASGIVELVLAAAGVVALGTTAAFLPAWRASHTAPGVVLRDG